MVVVLTERPIYEDRVDCGVRDDNAKAVFRGHRLYNVNRTTLQLLLECPDGSPLGGGTAEFIVYH